MNQQQPWLELYPQDVDATVEVATPNLAAGWQERVERNPEGTALIYFDTSYTARQVDEASDALAVALAERGVTKGDRIGIKLQNVPQFSLSLLTLWKLGAIGLLINPMYRGREYRRLIDDSRASGVIVDDLLYEETAADSADSSVEWIPSTSGLDLQSRNDSRIFASTEKPAVNSDGDLLELMRRYAGQRPEPVEITQDDTAVMTYTSGTTGPAKGATNTHGNLLSIAATNRAWLGAEPGDVMAAVAPLFHITGVGVVNTTALMHDGALLFSNRPNPDVIVETFAEYRGSFLIASITVFNAIYQSPVAGPQHFASAKVLMSGGAPTPPATVEAFEKKFGVYIHGVYGMTETTSAVIGCPVGTRAPVDAASGSLSIGVPLPNMDAKIVDFNGEELPYGEQGELELAGPQIVPGYWEIPEATAHTFPGGRLRTGDAGIMDAEGWIYLVDRLKDQINASGFKVWPREIEDVLYEHPAVYEAAVLGRPDEYRGETVVAFVSLAAGETVDDAELIAFCKERLAAYKYPREITIMKDLPKTETGKIRRRALRQ